MSPDDPVQPTTDLIRGTVRSRLANKTGASEYKVQQALNVHAGDPALLADVAHGKKKLRNAAKQVQQVNGKAERATPKKPKTFDLEREIKAAMKSVD